MIKSLLHLRTLFFSALVCCFLSACSSDSSEPSTNNNSVKLQGLTFSQWSNQLKNYQSKVVVVDLWAKWCIPCIERFPKMVELNKKYTDKGVAFVSINFDDPGDVEALQKAKAFLVEMDATFDNFYFTENLIDSFEHMGVIALPTVVIYDTKGIEHKRLTNTNPNKQFTGADIEEVVESLLAEQNS